MLILARGLIKVGQHSRVLGRRCLIACFLPFLALTRTASAENRLVLITEADVSVFEADPNSSINMTVLNVGVGRGLRREGRMISYCRFDLQSLPKSSWFHYVSVDSAELRLLAQSFGLPDETTKCFVTVNYCSQDDWSESGMTWDSRVSKERLEGQDSIVINGTDLPKIYMWDVTAGVVKAKSMGNSKITFELEGFPLTVHTLGGREIVPGEEFGPDTTLVGFVRFWSKERSQFGVNAVPTLTVYYSTHATALLNLLSSTIAVLSAIGVAAGLFEFVRKLRGRKVE